ncbi:MAG TPA: hypothetical protein VHG30_12420 [Microvirga sp.]|nr:hypothetical protein [Microvirga sp.]
MRVVAEDLDGFDAPATPRPRRPRRPARGRSWLRKGLVAAAILGGLVYFAGGRQQEPAHPPGSVPMAALIAPPPAWHAVAPVLPLYGLDGIEPTSFSLEVRRHADGGREDVMIFGDFGEAGYARLRMTHGPTGTEPQSFYVDLARQAAQAGLSVVRSAQAEPLGTKFGAAEVAAVTMAGPSEEACLALRLQADGSFSLRGWICGSVTQPGAEALVACLIDRLILVGGEDPALRRLFAEAERRRSEACRPAAARTASARNR